MVHDQNRRRPASAAAAVHDAFDPTRVAQARRVTGRSRAWLAERIGVSPATVARLENGADRLRPDVLSRLAAALDVPPAFFRAGRMHTCLDPAEVHFRSVLSSQADQRNRAVGYAEQVSELVWVLEKHVSMPLVNLPGWSGGELDAGTALPRDPVAAAAALRAAWGMHPFKPVAHLVRQLEIRGIIVTTPDDDTLTAVDAFSTAQLLRPLIVVTVNRHSDVYQHRFAVAHELGHLVLHSHAAPGNHRQEREADTFAAEFLTPHAAMISSLPRRADLDALADLREVWGTPTPSLLLRCIELGFLSEASFRRAQARLRDRGDRANPDRPERVAEYPGERPSMIAESFAVASTSHRVSVTDLARELAWEPATVRRILGRPQQRSHLRLISER
ncbi:helix-turn-helix domain-containing protein [Nocardia wallacei]|uniref:helix-turn-helix domain-containing protein n=1 Tax=Nocardia wallacei TaxID=480035 RepID=UPI00245876DE|nr:XRE family transcriptional regulator [Nocardia wallacei]